MNGYTGRVALVDGNLIHQKTKEQIIEGLQKKCLSPKKMLSNPMKSWIALELMPQEFL